MVREKRMPVFSTSIYLILLLKFIDIWVGLSVHVHTCRRVHRVADSLELGIMSCLILVIGTKLWSFTIASSVHKCEAISPAFQILCTVKWVQRGITWWGGSEIYISFWGEKMDISIMNFLTLNLFSKVTSLSWLFRHILHVGIMVFYTINIQFGHLVYSGKYE